MTKKSIYSILIALATGIIVGISSHSMLHKHTNLVSGETPDESWEFIKQSGLIKIGVDPSFFPMEYKDKNLALQGFDIDFIKLLGKELGVRVAIHEYALEDAINRMLRQQLDLVISAVEITPRRNAFLSLIEYFDMPQLLISYSEISEDTPLKHSVGVITSGYARQKLSQNNRQKAEPIRVNGFENIETLIAALDKGDFEQSIISSPTFLELDKTKRAALHTRRVAEYDQPLAIAVNPLNRMLTQKVQEAVAKIRTSKEYKELVLDWFENLIKPKKSSGGAE